MSQETKAQSESGDEPHQMKLLGIADQLDLEQETREAQTNFITAARILALSFFPRRRVRETTIVRTIRFGPECLVTVRYFVPDGCEMPFGADRFVLFGLIHLAWRSNSRLIEFEKAGELLDLFGLSDGGSEYKRLRARLKRLMNLSVDITSEGPVRTWGQAERVITKWSLPSRKQAAAEIEGQGSLSAAVSPYFVELSEGLFKQVEQGGEFRKILLLRQDLLTFYRDEPIGWDFFVFLAHRCGSAKGYSKVPHEVLMNLFKSGSQTDSATVRRLKNLLADLQLATKERFNAEFVEEPPKGGGMGRPRKRWSLLVGPSDPLIHFRDADRESRPQKRLLE